MEAWRGHFPLCLFKRMATGAKVPFHHRCRSKHILVVRRILPESPQTCPKSLLCSFCQQIFSHKDYEDLFLVQLLRKGLLVFLCKPRATFWRQTTSGAIFAQLFSKSKLLGLRLQPMNPHSNTTAFHNSIIGNFIVYKHRLETNLLQLFRHPDNSEWFSIIYVIIFDVNMVDEQKQTKFVTIFLL